MAKWNNAKVLGTCYPIGTYEDRYAVRILDQHSKLYPFVVEYHDVDFKFPRRKSCHTIFEAVETAQQICVEMRQLLAARAA